MTLILCNIFLIGLLQEMGVAMWYDGSEYCDDEDNFFKWYDSYKKQKAQKASIEEELMPVTWHPSRYWN